MGRIISVLAVVAVMAAILAFHAVPAFAAASDDASCKGGAISNFNAALPAGVVGEVLSEAAKDGGIGQFFGESRRSCNPNASPKGGGGGGGGV